MLQFPERGAQGFDALGVRQFVDQIVVSRLVRVPGRRGIALDQNLAPENRNRGRHRIRGRASVPAAQGLDRPRQVSAPRIGIGQRVVRGKQRRQQHIEGGQVPVIACGDQTVQRRIVQAAQDLSRVRAARILAPGPHVARIVCALWTLVPRRRERPIVAVEEPAVAGIQQCDRVSDRVGALPLGCRIAAVDRMREIECRMALRYEISVKVGDGPVGVRVHRVVGGIGAHVLSLAEGGVVGGFRAQIGLRQRGHRFLQQFDGDPLAVVVANNRSMMTAIHGEGAVPHRFALLEGNRYPADA